MQVMSGPISPKEAAAKPAIPDFVFEAVNSFLNGGPVTFTMNALIRRMVLPSDVKRHDIFEKSWLDFEPAYRAKGWRVDFDKPGFNESYEANWTFTPKSAP